MLAKMEVMRLGAAPSPQIAPQSRLLIYCTLKHNRGMKCRFAVKLSRAKQNLSHEDQDRLMSTLSQVLHGLPDIVRRPRLNIGGLTDATNLARFTFLHQLCHPRYLSSLCDGWIIAVKAYDIPSRPAGSVSQAPYAIAA